MIDRGAARRFLGTASGRELMNKLRHARRYGREPVGGLLEIQR